MLLSKFCLGRMFEMRHWNVNCLWDGWSLTSYGGWYPMGKMLILLQIQSRIDNSPWCHFPQNQICRYFQSEDYRLLLFYSYITLVYLIILSHPFSYLFTPLLLILFHYLNLMIHSVLGNWKESGVVLWRAWWFTQLNCVGTIIFYCLSVTFFNDLVCGLIKMFLLKGKDLVVKKI